jgi:hypothetical protein
LILARFCRQRHLDGPVRRWQEGLGCAGAKADPDLGLGQQIGQDATLSGGVQLGEDGRVRDVIRTDDGPQPRPVGCSSGDDLGNGLAAIGQVSSLLLEEIVIQPVEDEQRDEDQCQDDDGDKRQRQPGLEGVRRQRTQPAASPAGRLPGVSARRMRSPPPGQ